jgi:hypothetical protein
MSNNKVQCIVVRLEMKTLRGIWEWRWTLRLASQCV